MKHRYSAELDFTKAVLALLVTALHTFLNTPNPRLYPLLNPLTRMAVPTFFILSGYFFFRKINKVDSAERKMALINTEKRYVALYGFWFVLLLPVTLWTDFTLFSSPLHFLKQLVFNSTFSDSWYIMALIIAIPMICLLSSWMNNRCLIIIGVLSNALPILVTNYVGTNLGSMVAHHWYELPFRIYPYQSFIVALLWVTIGKLFADGQIHVNHNQFWCFGVSCGLIGLYLEQYLVLHFQWSGNGDCFFMLIPVCFLLFGLIIAMKPKRYSGNWLHAFATVTYCLHGSLLRVIIHLSFTVFHYRIVTNTGHLIVWVILLLGCAFATLLLTRVEKRKGFGWLRIAY